ncbi:hypothetical protein IF1G_08759 [Cordyceps javanica]|uniref:Uncharacterized protein n=1 Tax=Cordyceps javanica TaxID=43265 RepID=A0A545VK86_9HYPO|nr:hypothetical protein IF1G_08759 [Cordyceps javanica]TQW02148.1 hypothetical protein IF2G_10353 [Cordyceps javanica]
MHSHGPYSGARACLPPAAHPSDTATRDEGRAVTLRHPRYPDDSNILLVLPALDPIHRPSNSVVPEKESPGLGLRSPKKRVRDDTVEDDEYPRDADDAVWDRLRRPRKRVAYESATTSASSSLE